MAHLFFDARDGEWSVRTERGDFSDLSALLDHDPVIQGLGILAYDRNTER